jgi:DtxR family Mn-dependent transcriptional regulator
MFPSAAANHQGFHRQISNSKDKSKRHGRATSSSMVPKKRLQATCVNCAWRWSVVLPDLTADLLHCTHTGRSSLAGARQLARFGTAPKGWLTMITISKEDYLKAIAEAKAEGESVIAATLAHWLSVTRPAVTTALKRLTRDGLVSVKDSGHIQLTSKGRKIAEKTVLRHHLIERMLSEVFGMEWYEVHEEAERLEHAVSAAFERKLLQKLGDQDRCPHGNGLALRSPSERRSRGLILLSEAKEGSKYTVFSVYERDRKLLEFFESEGIRPGARISVKSRNYDGTVSLALGRKTSRLGGPAAERIWLSRE